VTIGEREGEQEPHLESDSNWRKSSTSRTTKLLAMKESQQQTHAPILLRPLQLSIQEFDVTFLYTIVHAGVPSTRQR
jgi:hypothetical protein